MIAKKIADKRGEGYIDMCVGVVVLVMILVIAINLFGFINLRVELDRVADNLIEAATYDGCFSGVYLSEYNAMQGDFFVFNETHGADTYFNRSYERVQLGERMWVEVSVDTYIKGLGVFKIPVTVIVKKSGLSEKYWKG